MMKDAKNKEFDVIIVLSLDRIFRSSKQLISVINELSCSNITLVAILNSFNSDSGDSKLALKSALQIASLDRLETNERICLGLAQKRIASEIAGSNWQLGRPSIPKDLIQKVIELRNQGLSIRGIERKLKRVISKTTIGRIVKSARAV